MTDLPNSDNIQESKANITQPMGIHSQSIHKYRNVFGDSNIQYHDFNNGDTTHFQRHIYHTITTRITKPLLVFT